jgi:hypothetical protein
MSVLPFDTPAAHTYSVIIEVIFEFVSNLAREQIPLGGQGLESKIEAVRRFKQIANSLREKPEVQSQQCKASSAKPEVQSQKCKAGSGKPDVMVAGCHFLLEVFGKRRFSG